MIYNSQSKFEVDYKHFHGKIEFGKQNNVSREDYDRSIIKCNSIIITLLTNLQNYVIDREDPSFFDKIFYDTELTAQRISLVAKPLIYYISNDIIQDFDNCNYSLIVGALATKIKQNDNLTKAFNGGIGRLEVNMKTALKELKTHGAIIINYRNNLSVTEVIGENLSTVFQKGNKLFGDFINFMES